MQPTRIIIPNVQEDERIGSSFNHLIRVVEETSLAQSKVVWDFKEVHFLHPFFLAPLAIYKQQSAKKNQLRKHFPAHAILSEQHLL